ncbi:MULTISPECIES: hypothetical protein [Synechococcaceae]|uniref:hypothetical protein n=1 Tax=Synechococcaceae TaxID=1890426 RepID=UPI000A42D61A|nr:MULTISPECIES: hypothetical protein [Synechococcaceae]MCT0245818.1 hypothetical protein [Synechococcus sp. CS-601]MCT4365225.1 hypothetical protein [Candidatus Regnicoccus frigidus MAG-AL1]MCT4367334.1 hypothetical protein [Candidatus Regnicoccus frigidus MAG-AL2]TWB95142.1 hypothetical protein FB106_102179 [Synechococcus sp. Ace-Pa]
MAGLLWQRRSQVGCCLLIQGFLLSVCIGLERVVQPPVPYPGSGGIARTRG